MKSWLMGLLYLMLSGAAIASGPGGVRTRVQANMLLTGTIVVAADGSVRSYAIHHADVVDPRAMALINDNVPAWKFEPVLRGGHPVVAKAKMSMRVVAQPVGDGDYALSIKGTHFGQHVAGEEITYTDRVQPTYPVQALRGRVVGTVYLPMRVGRQGQVEEAAAELVNLAVIASDQTLTQWRKIFARSALVAARK